MINQFALLKLSGADVRNFLQGQLTQDINRVSAGQAQFFGYCNNQGRLLATGVMWSDSVDDTNIDESIFMMVHKSIATLLQKRLSMFVLRAKVLIEQVESSIQAVYEPESNLTNGGTPHFPLLHCDKGAGLFSVGFPSPNANISRKLIIKLIEHKGVEREDEDQKWATQDILSGLPWITDKTYEKFLAQSLNLDIINAISFNKGCYVGQEVIARLHYKNKPKRRAFPVRFSEHSLIEGADIYDFGSVINISHFEGGNYVLAEIQLSSLESLHNQSDLELIPLPYMINLSQT
ncbi:putative aminomethyl transferase [Taylorella equigenitalis 14/56]|uniref:Putative aminomethyl transferase n=1 Tax=Taylorella equigenitalis 14/56 TaxID=1091497 RepID=I7JPE3_9BURK|nr:folate-binding protein YgfZ [Taylorella equigenitalis]CCG17963.1 putative aminomethyl transferase [Taylorella equigenitalis 14/56]